jgi:tetratricopeptide (TPR) repeat protein
MQTTPQKKSTNSLNIIIAIIFGVLWAFFWAIDAVVGYLLFGGACFFLVLYFYNRKLKAEAGHPTYGSERTHQAKTFTAPKPGQAVGLISVVLIALAVLAFLYNVTSSSNSTTTEEFSTNEIFVEEGTFLSKGNDSYNASMYDSAYYYYKRALVQTPDLADAWLGVGNVCYSREQKDSALWYYQKSIQVNPLYSQGRYNTAWWYYADKQYDKAISTVNRLYSDDVENIDAMQLLGDSYYAKVNYDSALIWYEKTYNKGTRSLWLCHVMAYLYDTKNDNTKAIALYKEALEYDATVIEIYDRLGELLPGSEGEEYRTEAARLKIENSN